MQTRACPSGSPAPRSGAPACRWPDVREIPGLASQPIILPLPAGEVTSSPPYPGPYQAGRFTNGVVSLSTPSERWKPIRIYKPASCRFRGRRTRRIRVRACVAWVGSVAFASRAFCPAGARDSIRAHRRTGCRVRSCHLLTARTRRTHRVCFGVPWWAPPPFHDGWPAGLFDRSNG